MSDKARELANAIKRLRILEERAKQTGPGGLMFFVRYFWSVLEPGREFTDGWAIHAMAEHLEAVERGEINRLLVTVPPGFMKSLMINVFMPTWIWGPQNKPHTRGLSFSYAAHLTERDNEKCRTLMQSKQYQELWGDRFKLSSDSKIKISNDHQGWLLASSVGGISTGERGDLIRCCKKDTLVVTEHGPVPIGKIVHERLPIKVLSQDIRTGEVSFQAISAWRHNPGAQLVKVTFSDGSYLECTPDHRVWASSGWRQAVTLQAGDMVPCAPILNVGNSLSGDAVFSSKRSQGGPLGVEYFENIDFIERRSSPCASFLKFITTIPNSSNPLRRYAVFLGNLFFRRRFFSQDRVKSSLIKLHRWSFSDALCGSFPVDRKIERTPSSTESDVHDGAGTHPVSLSQLSQGRVRLFCDLSNNFFCKAWRAISERPVIFTISNILRPRAISQIIKSWVSSVAVTMPNLLPIWTGAKESFGYYFVAEPIYSFPGQPQGNAGVALVEAWAKFPTFDFLRFSSVVYDSRQTANSSKAGNLVKPFSANYRLPDFVEVVSVENIGHVDETFCLTIPNNHTFYVQCQAEFGTGSKILIANCDDPHNAIQGESERVRNETVRWFKESMSNRLNDMKKSAIIVVHQRLHEEDCAGSILAEPDAMGYEHLNIPMEYETEPAFKAYSSIGWKDPRTYDGELAWPERFPQDECDKLKSILGPFGWSSQYMQNPEPRGGGIIKRNWWRLWEGKDNKFPATNYIIAALDPAYTEKQENDPSAMTVYGLFRHPETNEPGIMLMYAWRKRLALHGDTSPKFPGESHKAYERRCGDSWGLVEWVANTCDMYNADCLLIESKASGISVFQEIERRQTFKAWATELVDTGRLDKVARAYSVQGIFSQGLVWAPDRDFATMVIDEASAFPKARHEDLVDCTTMTLRRLREMGLLQFQDEREFEEYVEQNRSPVTQPLYPV